MARQTTSLTATQIKQAKPKEKEYTLADGDGLLLRIRPNGSKTWMFNYYVPITKKRNKISFGSYPDVSLAYAREQRDRARELLAKEVDPKAYKLSVENCKREELANTFGAFAREFLAIKKETTEASTFKKRVELVNKHLIPAIGNTPVTEIKPMTMKAILDPLAKQGIMETVKRICSVSNEIMRIAMANGAIEFNPLVDLTRLYPAKKVKHHPALSPEELPELVSTLEQANIKIVTQNLILWQLHTMVRPSEAAKAKWSQIDFEEKVWTVPIPKMKKSHTVPLPPQTLAILEDMKPISGHREFIFPADRDPKKHASTQTANKALERMGFKGRTTSHGLRGLASTTMNAHGFEGDLIESCLSHEVGSEIRRAYNHSDFLERRKPLMHWWSDRIEQAGKGEILKVSVRGLRIA
jgi:integrase